MKKIIKENLGFIIGILIITGIFFAYGIVVFADTAEYFGLASYIGTSKMMDSWIGHRGIGFPLLLRIFQPFGIQSSLLMEIMLFIFYLITLFTIYEIYKKCKEFINNKFLNIFFIICAILMVVINPIIFGYAHSIVPEFVGMSLGILTCYLAWIWVDTKHKKKIILAFMLIAVFFYHEKQAHLFICLSAMLISAFISIIKFKTWKNFLYRALSIILVIIVVLISILIWKLVMNNAITITGNDIVGSTLEERVNGRLSNGITKNLTVVTKLSELSTQNIDINELDISEEEKEEIQKIIDNESEYTDFVIYKNNNDEYFVYLKTDGNIKEQLAFYFKILTKSPLDILVSYKKIYKSLIFGQDYQLFSKEVQYFRFKENYVFPMTLFGTDSNKAYDGSETMCNDPIYDEYLEPYKTIIQENIFTKYYNKLEKELMSITTVFTKVSLYYFMPFLLLILTIVYCVIHKKVNQKNLKILELIIICYGTGFGFLVGYTIFGAETDRYIVPSLIPSYIGDILLVILIIKIIHNKISSKKLGIKNEVK